MSNYKNKRKTILKVIVGSHATGLVGPNSDIDFFSVFTYPTSLLVSLCPPADKGRSIHTEEMDTVAHELGHFLRLAMKCNPSVLEVFKAPTIKATKEGEELKGLFNAAWNTKGVVDAYCGYAKSQLKRLQRAGEEEVRWKALSTAVRILEQGISLLETGDFNIVPPNAELLLEIKRGKIPSADVFALLENRKEKINEVANKITVYKESDIPKLNEFLLKIRRENW